ncbi:MAG: ATP-binding protein [Bacteroidota bacterium]
MSNQSAHIFSRLSKWYLLALAAIAIVFLVSHNLIQSHLDKQLNDSRIVNVAGRQRMLSQKLSKEVLKLTLTRDSSEISQIVQDLDSTLQLWIKSHQGLKEGDSSLDLPGKNSKAVQKMIEEIEPHFFQIVTSSEEIIKQFTSSQEHISLDAAVLQVLQNEGPFLLKMDQLVFQYDREAKNKVLSLRRIEYFLLAFAILTLIIELVFIFQPIAKYVKNIVSELTQAEKKAQKSTAEITQLYKQKEQSILELRALNFALDQASLFASTDLKGDIIYISDKLVKFLAYKEKPLIGNFAKILSSDEEEQEYIDNLFRTPHSRIWNGEIAITTLDLNKAWLEISIVPVNRSGVKQDYLILCNDITTRKITQAQLQRLNQEKFEEEIQLQKTRSLQVIEAQENERKRIARDIHDGLGQMLTALKFNLESVNLKTQPSEKVSQKMEDLKSLSSKLIKGVRMATFNLTPPELTDYGIAIALAKLASELKKLTAENILFENRTEFSGRLAPIVEINLYRIIQEAVNNSIKYAKASYILITLAHSNNLLSLVVEDDGIGFEHLDLENKDISEDGSNMGLAFMKERVNYINGRIFIRSQKDLGTRITINLPLDTN